MVLWFHINFYSIVMSAIFIYFVSISVLFSTLFLYSINKIDLVPYKWYQSTFFDRKLWVNFFRVETYSDVLNLQISIITFINPWSRSDTRRKYKRYSSTHLLATLVTPVGNPLSGSASQNTCIWIDLDLLNPSIDKPIDRLNSIVPSIKKLGKILSSTWAFK
jgi:hypothetical protein